MSSDERLSVRYFDQVIASRLCRIDCRYHAIKYPLNEAPSAPAQNNYCDLSLTQVLLVNEILIRRQQHIESSFLRFTEQFTIKESVPPLLLSSFNDMSVK